jgi:hypothetical protein
MKTTRIADLVPAEAHKRLNDLMDKIGRGNVANIHKTLVEFLEPYREDILKKGVLVEYLAYFIESVVPQVFKKKEEGNA